MFYRFYDLSSGNFYEVDSAQEAVEYALERATKKTTQEPIVAKLQALSDIVGRMLQVIEATVGPERAAEIVNCAEAYEERTDRHCVG